MLIAFLRGTAFVCLVSLLLKLPLGLYFLLFLTLGAIALAPFSTSIDKDSILPLVLANVLFYSAFSFLWLSLPTLSQKLRNVSLRSLSIKLGFATVFLVVLACIPSLNPLWPHHMKQLRWDQHDLELALPAGISVAEALEVLRKRKIPVFDEPAIEDTKRRRLYGRVHTDAWNFPAASTGSSIDSLAQTKDWSPAISDCSQCAHSAWVGPGAGRLCMRHKIKSPASQAGPGKLPVGTLPFKSQNHYTNLTGVIPNSHAESGQERELTVGVDHLGSQKA